ncbi:MAG: hypothetical protein Tsb005_14720 [Gammaproteobacteria bacterium]
MKYSTIKLTKFPELSGYCIDVHCLPSIDTTFQLIDANDSTELGSIIAEQNNYQFNLVTEGFVAIDLKLRVEQLAIIAVGDLVVAGDITVNDCQINANKLEIAAPIKAVTAIILQANQIDFTCQDCDIRLVDVSCQTLQLIGNNINFEDCYFNFDHLMQAQTQKLIKCTIENSSEAQHQIQGELTLNQSDFVNQQASFIIHDKASLAIAGSSNRRTLFVGQTINCAGSFSASGAEITCDDFIAALFNSNKSSNGIHLAKTQLLVQHQLVIAIDFQAQSTQITAHTLNLAGNTYWHSCDVNISATWTIQAACNLTGNENVIMANDMQCLLQVLEKRVKQSEVTHAKENSNISNVHLENSAITLNNNLKLFGRFTLVNDDVSTHKFIVKGQVELATTSQLMLDAVFVIMQGVINNGQLIIKQTGVIDGELKNVFGATLVLHNSLVVQAMQHEGTLLTQQQLGTNYLPRLLVADSFYMTPLAVIQGNALVLDAKQMELQHEIAVNYLILRGYDLLNCAEIHSDIFSLHFNNQVTSKKLIAVKQFMSVVAWSWCNESLVKVNGPYESRTVANNAGNIEATSYNQYTLINYGSSVYLPTLPNYDNVTLPQILESVFGVATHFLPAYIQMPVRTTKTFLFDVAPLVSSVLNYRSHTLSDVLRMTSTTLAQMQNYDTADWINTAWKAYGRIKQVHSITSSIVGSHRVMSTLKPDDLTQSESPLRSDYRRLLNFCLSSNDEQSSILTVAAKTILRNMRISDVLQHAQYWLPSYTQVSAINIANGASLVFHRAHTDLVNVGGSVEMHFSQDTNAWLKINNMSVGVKSQVAVSSLVNAGLWVAFEPTMKVIHWHGTPSSILLLGAGAIQGTSFNESGFWFGHRNTQVLFDEELLVKPEFRTSSGEQNVFKSEKLQDASRAYIYGGEIWYGKHWMHSGDLAGNEVQIQVDTHQRLGASEVNRLILHSSEFLDATEFVADSNNAYQVKELIVSTDGRLVVTGLRDNCSAIHVQADKIIVNPQSHQTENSGPAINCSGTHFSSFSTEETTLSGAVHTANHEHRTAGSMDVSGKCTSETAVVFIAEEKLIEHANSKVMAPLVLLEGGHIIQEGGHNAAGVLMLCATSGDITLAGKNDAHQLTIMQDNTQAQLELRGGLSLQPQFQKQLPDKTYAGNIYNYSHEGCRNLETLHYYVTDKDGRNYTGSYAALIRQDPQVALLYQALVREHPQLTVEQWHTLTSEQHAILEPLLIQMLQTTYDFYGVRLQADFVNIEAGHVHMKGAVVISGNTGVTIQSTSRDNIPSTTLTETSTVEPAESWFGKLLRLKTTTTDTHEVVHAPVIMSQFGDIIWETRVDETCEDHATQFYAPHGSITLKGDRPTSEPVEVKHHVITKRKWLPAQRSEATTHQPCVFVTSNQSKLKIEGLTAVILNAIRYISGGELILIAPKVSMSTPINYGTHTTRALQLDLVVNGISVSNVVNLLAGLCNKDYAKSKQHFKDLLQQLMNKQPIIASLINAINCDNPLEWFVNMWNSGISLFELFYQVAKNIDQQKLKHSLATHLGLDALQVAFEVNYTTQKSTGEFTTDTAENPSIQTSSIHFESPEVTLCNGVQVRATENITFQDDAHITGKAGALKNSSQTRTATASLSVNSKHLGIPTVGVGYTSTTQKGIQYTNPNLTAQHIGYGNGTNIVGELQIQSNTANGTINVKLDSPVDVTETSGYHVHADSGLTVSAQRIKQLTREITANNKSYIEVQEDSSGLTVQQATLHAADLLVPESTIKNLKATEEVVGTRNSSFGISTNIQDLMLNKGNNESPSTATSPFGHSSLIINNKHDQALVRPVVSDNVPHASGAYDQTGDGHHNLKITGIDANIRVPMLTLKHFTEISREICAAFSPVPEQPSSATPALTPTPNQLPQFFMPTGDELLKMSQEEINQAFGFYVNVRLYLTDAEYQQQIDKLYCINNLNISYTPPPTPNQSAQFPMPTGDELLKMSQDEINQAFGFYVHALSYVTDADYQEQIEQLWRIQNLGIEKAYRDKTKYQRAFIIGVGHGIKDGSLHVCRLLSDVLILAYGNVIPGAGKLVQSAENRILERVRGIGQTLNSVISLVYDAAVIASVESVRFRAIADGVDVVASEEWRSINAYQQLALQRMDKRKVYLRQLWRSTGDMSDTEVVEHLGRILGRIAGKAIAKGGIRKIISYSVKPKKPKLIATRHTTTSSPKKGANQYVVIKGENFPRKTASPLLQQTCKKTQTYAATFFEKHATKHATIQYQRRGIPDFVKKNLNKFGTKNFPPQYQSLIIDPFDDDSQGIKFLNKAMLNEIATHCRKVYADISSLNSTNRPRGKCINLSKLKQDLPNHLPQALLIERNVTEQKLYAKFKFVITPKGELNIASPLIIHPTALQMVGVAHTQLTKGERFVIAAGEFTLDISTGKINKITNHSGHYRICYKNEEKLRKIIERVFRRHGYDEVVREMIQMLYNQTANEPVVNQKYAQFFQKHQTAQRVITGANSSKQVIAP